MSGMGRRTVAELVQSTSTNIGLTGQTLFYRIPSNVSSAMLSSCVSIIRASKALDFNVFQ